MFTQVPNIPQCPFMKQAFYTVLFILSCLPANVFSQVKIEGVLRLGDTTQMLVLQTQYGDQFVGTLGSWSQDELTFKLKTGDVLGFKLLDVRSLKVMGDPVRPAPLDPGTGQFTASTNDGRVYEGQIISLNQRTVKMKLATRERAYLETTGVEEIVFGTDDRFGSRENSFRLILKNGDKLNGRFLQMNEKTVKFQPMDGKPWTIARSQVGFIRRLKPYRPMNGHRRALLLTPTGFNLRKGEGEFRNIDYIHNSYAVGLSDNLSATVGLMGVEPYVQAKASTALGKYLHLAAGGGISVIGAYGWFAAASVGTPDYYLNMGYMRNKGQLTVDETDMDAIFFGGSMRVGNRQRAFAEFTYLTEQKYLFDANGFGTNTFAFGYGWFSRRVSLNIGMMLVENSDAEFCFNPFFTLPCESESFYFTGIPVISTSIMFGEMYRK